MNTMHTKQFQFRTSTCATANSTMRAVCMACALLASAWATGLAHAAPPDGGITALQASVQTRIVGVGPGFNAPGSPLVRLPQPTQDSTAELAALLKPTLTADSAVRIALLNNTALQAALGAASVDITDISRVDHPAKRRARQEIAALSAQASRAWINAVAAEQSVRLLRTAKETAETTGELSRRMVQAGNTPKLAQARTQLALSDATLALARAQLQAQSAREALIVTLGLWGAQTQFQLPQTLPALPAQAINVTDVEARALQARDDLTQARTDWQRKSPTPATDADGLWDALRDAAQVRGAAVVVRSQAREAAFAYRSTLDIAQHLQTEVLPLRNFVNDEMVLRYNGMLSSLFDVLADSQAATLAANAALEAQRDFWLAHIDLSALLAGVPLDSLSTRSSASSATPGAAAAAH
jgi:outer membrane protein, multidrug efflux system